MEDLAISPQGHLLVRETSEGADRAISSEILDAFRQSGARGMLDSASEHPDATLPPAMDFARSIGGLYWSQLCRVATGQPGETLPELPPPAEDLDQAIRKAPPMVGLEYLNVDVASQWWRDLDRLARNEVGTHPDGAAGYLRDRAPRWQSVGRGHVPSGRKQA